MASVPLTMALEHYDRHIPFFDGSVVPDGVDLTVYDVGQSKPGRHGEGRHERMVAGEFDVAELSLSSYLMVRDRGQPFTAIPVFPRRLFSQSRIYVNSAAGINSPRDLAGKRMGLNAYQVTLSVLAKGDLAHEYGVPWREITYVVAHPEVVAFELPAGVKVEQAPAGLDTLLLSGDIQALALPHPPRAVQDGDTRVRRLFADAPAEERAFLQRNSYWPIMHVVAFKESVVREHPWAPRAFYAAFERAKEECFRYYDDPNWSRLAWGRHYFEAELAAFGGDPWPNGLARNRANLERFIGYSHDQGLIRERMSPESLFVEALQGE
jgi:4,5-dihydroxyphthalate decarboxylase